MDIKEFNQKYGVSINFRDLDEKSKIMMIRLGARLKRQKICSSIKNLTAKEEESLSGEKRDKIKEIVDQANQSFKVNFLNELFDAVKKHIISAVIKDDDEILPCDKILTFARDFINVAVESIARWEFSKMIFPEPRGILTVREITKTVKDALCEVENYEKIYSLLCKEKRLGFTSGDVEMLLYKNTDPSLNDLKILARHKEGLALCIAERNEMKSLASLIRSRQEKRVLKKVEAFIDRHADGSKSSIYSLARVKFDFVSAFNTEIEEYEELEYKRDGKIFQCE